LLAILCSALFVLIPAIVADAANPESVTVDMTFLDPVTITENNPLQFGLLDVNMGNNQKVTVAPDGTVTDTQNNVFGGTQAAANLTVKHCDGLCTRNLAVQLRLGRLGFEL
jgi:hypothetical protein